MLNSVVTLFWRTVSLLRAGRRSNRDLGKVEGLEPLHDPWELGATSGQWGTPEPDYTLQPGTAGLEEMAQGNHAHHPRDFGGTRP